MTSVWIYIDTSKQVADHDHLKVFASLEAADSWLQLKDPKGVAFEHEIEGDLLPGWIAR